MRRKTAMYVAVAGLLAAATVSAGCSPKWAPYSPDYAAERTYAPGRQPLRLDHPLFEARYRFTLPVYTPVASCPSAAMGTRTTPAVVPGQKWIALATLDQDILVLYLPESPPAGSQAALGLAVHRDGRLYSSRPWYDLDKGRRIPQPPWRPSIAPLFAPQDTYVLDCFASDLVYRGRDDAHLLFEKRAFTCMSAAPAATSAIHLPSEAPATLVCDRLRITIRPSLTGNGDYAIEEAPIDAPEGCPFR